MGRSCHVAGRGAEAVTAKLTPTEAFEEVLDWLSRQLKEPEPGHEIVRSWYMDRVLSPDPHEISPAHRPMFRLWRDGGPAIYDEKKGEEFAERAYAGDAHADAVL